MIYKYIFFILLIFVVGCQFDCQDAKYFDLEYTNERIELLFSNDNAEFFEHFDSSNQFAYKWITNKNELTEYLQQTQLKLRADTSKMDSFDFEHYNLFAIIYWEGCTNAKHDITLCENSVVHFSMEQLNVCDEGMVLRLRLILVPKRVDRVDYYGRDLTLMTDA